MSAPALSADILNEHQKRLRQKLDFVSHL
jgi:hypothetical protein